MADPGIFDTCNEFIQCLFKSMNVNSDDKKVMKGTISDGLLYLSQSSQTYPFSPWSSSKNSYYDSI